MRVRRPSLFAGVALTIVALASPAGAGEPNFAPKSLRISRATLAGVTPRSSFAEIKANWGSTPIAGPTTRSGWGRSVAIWRSSGLGVPSAATVNWARSVGVDPIRFSVNLAEAKRQGFALRTTSGDRAGTPVRTFRRHWPQTRRVPSGPGFTYYVAQSSYRGWLLAFLFRDGKLMYAELVEVNFFNACLAKACSRGYPRTG